MEVRPIYGSSLKMGCPDPPEGNKNAVNYLLRLRDILTQLNANKDKPVASTRLQLLLNEFRLTNPKIV